MFEDVFVAEHVCDARLVGLHRPVHDVDPVGEKIGHRAATEIPELTPDEKFVFAEGLIGCVAEPLLPVERAGVDDLARAMRLVVLPPVGADLGDAAEAAALDEIDGVAEMAPTALLHAALEDLLAGADGFGEDGAFFERVGDGLFEVDVFAGGDGVGGDANVPMIGSRDEDGVELLIEDFFVIDVSAGIRSCGAIFDGVAARGVNVADGDDLVSADAIGGIEEVIHAAAGADDADAERVVGAEDAGGSESGHSGGDDEVAAIDWDEHGESILAERGRRGKRRWANARLRTRFTSEILRLARNDTALYRMTNRLGRKAVLKSVRATLAREYGEDCRKTFSCAECVSDHDSETLVHGLRAMFACDCGDVPVWLSRVLVVKVLCLPDGRSRAHLRRMYAAGIASEAATKTVAILQLQAETEIFHRTTCIEVLH